MTDPRVELAGLAGGSAAQTDVLARLDGVRVVLTIAAGRGNDPDDVAGLVNLVNLGARIFPHWQLPEPNGVLVDSPAVGQGPLGDVLANTVARVRSQPASEPLREFHLCWGATPSGPGLAVDASGWSCSLGPVHLPLAPQEGPPVGALAVGCWAVGQLLVEALEPLGVPCHRTLGFRWNLLTYGLDEAPATSTREVVLPPFVNAGCGSVGSSVLYAAIAAHFTSELVDLVDPDTFTARNRGRYPILLDAVVDVPKTSWLADRCLEAGIAARPHAQDLAAFTNGTDQPPLVDLVIASVDTVVGRRDATDLLAKTTINVGVSGLAFHVSRHGFGDRGCAYCQYVDVAPALSGAQMLAELVGLPVERIVALERDDGRLSEADAQALAIGGRYGDRPPAAGSRLVDLRRRAYAQASIVSGAGDLRVSAPHVSALAGVVALAEIIKHGDPSLAPFRLADRVDLDLSGQPSGFVGVARPDGSGRCLCHSGFRRKAWASMHGVGPVRQHLATRHEDAQRRPARRAAA